MRVVRGNLEGAGSGGIAESVGEEAGPEFGLEPRAFRRHVHALVGDVHDVVDRDRVQGESNIRFASVDGIGQDLGAADTADEIDALVAYLEFVDTTGTYPPDNYEVTWFGTVRQEDDP